ncbi:MAG TPA: MogA/MoaB family molybdenum cofactor biosynthesis protein [Bryobacteraceae bacterium]|jgi:molybdenum cofactor synthesis domain-containing protein|nr:MogA/MoaB family molybdenum cofactor biosynthesis protein [Bryobacteraceae bacterium]
MITVAILTISDSAVAGTREDLCGPSLRKRCEELGWIVTERILTNDDENAIAAILADRADRFTASLILTTGGTGVASRDVTPEATRRVLDREIPGIPELVRLEGRAQTKFSALSRALAGSRKRSLIVNLPGSPKGALHSLNVIAELVPHVIQLLQGKTEHTAGGNDGTVVETQQSGVTS